MDCSGDAMSEWYTYRGAAKEAKKSVRAIKRWRAQGMPMTFDGHGRRVVEREVLFAWKRAKLQANPAHQQKMRRMRREGAFETL
jgi:hypothetical protein